MAKTKEEAVVAHSDGIVVAYVRQGYSVARTLLTKYLDGRVWRCRWVSGGKCLVDGKWEGGWMNYEKFLLLGLLWS